eukprot:TRINITY_DN19715_c0_g1_i1.p1 TRINITY_DN19715_c0_g1~~TRINITY_DN19715_c0_g1_i1.p1  ORF type:complete len:144 (-),score=14.78 TRINITY_DN19715_c0_g1_i1:76-507(-)
MKFLLICLLALLKPSIESKEEDFEAIDISLGRKTCICSFSLAVDGITCSATATCDSKCSGTDRIFLSRYSFDLKVWRGNAAIHNCKIAGKSPKLTSRTAIDGNAYWKAVVSEIMWFTVDFFIGLGVDLQARSDDGTIWWYEWQ